MNELRFERRFKVEHLREYTGILTSEISNNRFKMGLKLEDNPVLERSIKKIESNIVLEFRFDYSLSPLFFHNIHTCQTPFTENKDCPDCKKVEDMYKTLESNLYGLQVGDTFRIKAALINNGWSELLLNIQSFKDYEPLVVACDEHALRLPDTEEGINKKKGIKEQKLQQEQEAEEKRQEDEEQAQKDAKRRKWKEKFQQFLGKSPNTNQIIVTVVGTTIANQIPLIFKGLKYIYRLIFPN